MIRSGPWGRFCWSSLASRGESGGADRQQPGGRRGDAAALDARLSERISRPLRNVVGPVEGPTEPELIRR
jgi:hypothetical protein